MELSDKQMAEKAKKIRKQIDELSDRELAYFSDSIYFENFDSVSSHIKRIANNYDPTIPF